MLDCVKLFFTLTEEFIFKTYKPVLEIRLVWPGLLLLVADVVTAL